jgi:2-oxo-4-hydroxy-4-carboxy-5-ureidoimidazoline decarboxylase
MMAERTLREINRLDESQFVQKLGNIYEESPWVAERVASDRPFETVEALRTAMQDVVDSASRERKLELLRAHPDLGDQTGITDASQEEQASAGLDRLTAEQYDAFERLNGRYQEKFGFPFIMAVKGASPSEVRDAMESRVEHSESAEFQTALGEVHTIAKLRLDERFRS